MSDSISIISCDNIKFTLPHSIYSQFNLFLSHKKDNKEDKSPFQLKFTSKALTEIIDLLNEDKRKDVLTKFPKTCNYLQFFEYDIDASEKVLKLIKENKMVSEFRNTTWNRENISQIDGYKFHIKCDFVRDTKKHHLEQNLPIIDSYYYTINLEYFIIGLCVNQEWKYTEDKIYLEITCKVNSRDKFNQMLINNRQ